LDAGVYWSDGCQLSRSGLSDASLDLLVSMLVERRFDAGAILVAT
jgi:hypothetical protein